MTKFGFSLICEEHHPTELVANAQRAEAAGFDLLTSRTCSTPWHGSHFAQPLRQSVLGALAGSPIGLSWSRWSPVRPALPPGRRRLKAATVAVMSDRRFQLGLAPTRT
jgi:hypothetical protein